MTAPDDLAHQEIERLLSEHRPTATMFCAGCDWTPVDIPGWREMDEDALHRAHLASVLSRRDTHVRAQAETKVRQAVIAYCDLAVDQASEVWSPEAHGLVVAYRDVADKLRAALPRLPADTVRVNTKEENIAFRKRWDARVDEARP